MTQQNHPQVSIDEMAHAFEDESGPVDLPRGFVFYTVFVAFVLMLLRAVQNFVKDLTGRKTVREEAAETGPTGV